MSYYIWEVAVCFYETFLVIYLFCKKLGFHPKHLFRLIVSTLIMISALSVLTLICQTTILRMTIMLGLYIFMAVWAFDCTKLYNWYRALLCPACYLVMVTVADNITFSLAEAMTDYPLEELMTMGSARIQFTLIYLLLVTLMVWAGTHIGEHNSEFPFPVSLILFVLLGIGIFVTETILDISLELRTSPSFSGQANKLSLLCYGIILIIFVLIVMFEYLAVVLNKNRILMQQQQLATMEQQHYDLMVSTAESLTQWKHDYQGQLRLIGTLIEQGKYSELKQFSSELISDLPAFKCLLLSGNRTMDAVISLRMLDAKRLNIRFNTTLFLPDPIPLSDVAFASLVGNLLDNAIDACREDPSEKAEIHFQIKPWKQMMYIFCTNTSEGKYLSNEHGKLLSTKAEAGHGIGIRRIKEIVAQTGGTYQFTPETDRFSVSIMIPLLNKNIESKAKEASTK